MVKKEKDDGQAKPIDHRDIHREKSFRHLWGKNKSR